MEGFLRSLSADIWDALGFLVFVVIMYVLAVFFTKHSATGDVTEALRKMRILFRVVVLLVVVVLLGRAASVAFANRIPRNDVDKSSTYEQMKSHGQDQNPR